MHNHYENGRPSIVPESKFTKNQPIYLMQEAYINSPIQIITNGLQQVLAGESYSWINYNCQSYVNRATNNSHASEAVEKWAGGIAFSLLLLIGAKAFSNSK
jgi:hypothetical protein